MKKILLVCLMLLTVSITARAQDKGFVCTGNNVNIRKGPGKNYPVLENGAGTNGKLQLFKGNVVTDYGKRKNQKRLKVKRMRKKMIKNLNQIQKKIKNQQKNQFLVLKKILRRMQKKTQKSLLLVKNLLK